jgi:crotonobetainyl-CoA:carnitine CoA-transferase CaiB-like acyl-CoA transferase
MPLPLSGLLVVSLEQAVAAPMCTCRLADAGARVIKVERPEGDFARYYDKLAVPTSPGGSAEGQSAYFVWLNRGKESVVLDLARADDKALLAAILTKADVFVQNLKPGAIAKLGFPLDELRRAHPRLVICSISGYGEDGPYAARKAYDMLVQAESGLASVTGGPEAPARVGVSVCDVAAGMNAYEAILAALLARERSGDGAAISISMFDAMAEWMAVPLIQYEGGAPPKRMGLAHTSIAPYGAFKKGRRRHFDFDPERPRVARAGGKGARRQGARRRSRLCHQRRAREAPRRDRRARRRGVRRNRGGGADAKARGRRHRVRPRQRDRRSRGPPAAPPHRRRHALGRRELPRAARAR